MSSESVRTRQFLPEKLFGDDEVVRHFLHHALGDGRGFPQIDVFVDFQIIILHIEGVVDGFLVDGELAVNEINMLPQIIDADRTA